MRASTHEPSDRLRSILDRARLPDDTSATPDESPPLLTPPSVVTQSRWQVSRRAALGAGVVLLAAVLVLVGRTMLAERAAEPVPVSAPTSGITARGDRSAFATTPAPTGAGGSGAGSSPGVAEVYVHVVGRVRSPGVVRLPTGSRVADAVTKDGGVTGTADVAQVNLARVVVDGEQIVVPRTGDPPVAGPGSAGTSGDPAAVGTGGAGAPGGLVSLNTADQAGLEALPGVGPVLAERIIEWRTANGGFTTVEELHEVSGIGEKLFAQISPKVTV